MDDGRIDFERAFERERERCDRDRHYLKLSITDLQKENGDLKKRILELTKMQRDKMTRKEEIAELLKQSPSGLLWSESGAPVYVDSTGMARYCSNKYLFLQGDNLYPLPPLLREEGYKGQSTTGLVLGDKIERLEAELRLADKEKLELKAQLAEARTQNGRYRQRVDILEEENRELKVLVQPPQRLKLTPCSEPPDNIRDVLIWNSDDPEGIAYFDQIDAKWFPSFAAAPDWPKDCHWSELPEVE